MYLQVFYFILITILIQRCERSVAVEEEDENVIPVVLWHGMGNLISISTIDINRLISIFQLLQLFLIAFLHY